MTPSLEVLEAQVACLAPADRARLLEHLIAGLDVEEEMEAAWDAVAAAREADAASGKAPAIPLEKAVARLEARFPG
jgi:Putative addiction module component